MPNIREYESPVRGVSPTNVGVDAAASAGRRVAGFYDEAAAGQGRVASAFEQVARTDEQLARVQGEAGRVQEGAFNAIGRDASSTIRDVGNVIVKAVEHREISHGAVGYAGLNDQLTQQWNDLAKNADPNDPTVAARFKDQVLEPALEKFKQGFMSEGGQDWAERRVESLRNHMFDKTAADMATLAADAVAVNVKRTANTFSNTAMNDPSAVPHLLEGVDSTIGAMVDSSPNLKGAAAARARTTLTQSMKEQIVKSGAIGAIMQSGNPEATAKAWGARFPEFISGDELKMLGANARAQIRAARVDANYARAMEKERIEAVSDKVETDYLKKLYSPDLQEKGQVSTRAIVNDPNLTRTAKERMRTIVERELKPETATAVSNKNAMDLLDRIRRPAGDPQRIEDLNPIYDARTKGLLNRTDFESLRKEFTDVRTPEGERITARKNAFLKAVSPTIDKSNPLMGKIDNDGKINAYKLMVDLDNKIAEFRKEGKNPYDLLDPSKPDYMGSPAALQPYMKTLQDSIRDQTQRLKGGNLTGPGKAITGVQVTPAAPAPPAAPRKPGESAADYLKRIGPR